jgi:hypothetical protein
MAVRARGGTEKVTAGGFQEARKTHYPKRVSASDNAFFRLYRRQEPEGRTEAGTFFRRL